LETDIARSIQLLHPQRATQTGADKNVRGQLAIDPRLPEFGNSNSCGKGRGDQMYVLAPYASLGRSNPSFAVVVQPSTSWPAPNHPVGLSTELSVPVQL
jgi:hypothetical protein